MEWADHTFWVRQTTDRSPKYAVVVDDEGTVTEDLDLLKSEFTLARVFHPCRECSHLHGCMNSVWKDGKRVGGPLTTESPYSSAQRCRICLQPFLEFRPDQQRDLTPECPRLVGEATCVQCRNLGWDVRSNHPAVVRRRAAFSRVFQAMSQGQEVDSKGLMDALLKDDYQLDEHLDHQAQKILGLFLNDLTRRLPNAWAGIPVEDLQVLRQNLETYLYSALRTFPDDPEKIVRAFLLGLVPSISERWSKEPLASRRFAIRVWEGMVITSMMGSSYFD